MPNHVEMDISVSGPVNDLLQSKEFSRDGEALLSADKFIPYPDKFKTLDKQAEEERKNGNYSFRDGFNSGGYEWCIENWGTKWGIYDTEMVGEKLGKKVGTIKYSAQSAWSPPLKVIKAMSDKFPTLKISVKYFECGAGYKGVFVVKGGEIITNTEAKYSGRRGG